MTLPTKTPPRAKPSRNHGFSARRIFLLYNRKRLVVQRRRYEGVYNRIAEANGIACGEEKRARRASGGVSLFFVV
jgi:hypothetical protein